ncbi:hypothetical protein ACLF3G_05880 [Falsiroseomonas sp. HC035]|uniref:hypothetical protein n=1 Tax=Falsiroseomonas sp. HC035 TaxID=3390999 RepID=UPI003D31A906
MSSHADQQEPDPEAAGPLPVARSLDSILLELRQLALIALDSDQPMAAVLIAGTADRLEATIPPLPPRPSYP